MGTEVGQLPYYCPMGTNAHGRILFWAGASLGIRNACRRGYGCSIGVLVSNRGRTAIAGTGQIEVVGDLTTVVSRSSPAKENSGG